MHIKEDGVRRKGQQTAGALEGSNGTTPWDPFRRMKAKKANITTWCTLLQSSSLFSACRANVFQPFVFR